MNVKSKGQVYTPSAIVNDVLDCAYYRGCPILRRHIMENSFGEGAFLSEIVRRYISAAMDYGLGEEDIRSELGMYIHGIDIDESNFERTKYILDCITDEYGIGRVDWDLRCADTLTTDEYDGLMDWVVGNPPYVRVHNLGDQYDTVKQYLFARKGMTDLYLTFFEKGLRMLVDGGRLAYITPSSYFTSLAGTELRRYIRDEQCVESIWLLGGYNPFGETTYTAITSLVKKKMNNGVEYRRYSPDTGRPCTASLIPYEELFVNGCIFPIADEDARRRFAEIYSIDTRTVKGIQVKNGFETHRDSVFIKDDLPDSGNVIRIVKASTGKWSRCIYPYDGYGRLIPFRQLDNDIQSYLTSHRESLEQGNEGEGWYGFGRTQAVGDVGKFRIAINQLIIDADSVKMQKVMPGEGIYGGLYILIETDDPDRLYDRLEKVLKTDEFISYVKCLGRCRRGGYYVFSASDLRKYLAYEG